MPAMVMEVQDEKKAPDSFKAAGAVKQAGLTFFWRLRPFPKSRLVVVLQYSLASRSVVAL